MASPRQPAHSTLGRLLARLLILALVAGLLPADAHASVPGSPATLDSPGLPDLAVQAAASATEGLVCVVVFVAADPSGLTKSAFGELLAHTGSDPQPYAFTGEPLDPNSGFQYHRARWMDPRTGRFTGMDPFEGMSPDPLSLHRYLYAHASPVLLADPSGKFASVGEISIGLALVNTIASQQVLAGADIVSDLLFRGNATVQQAKVVIKAAGAAITLSALAVGVYRATGALVKFLRQRGVTDDLPGIARPFALPSAGAPPNPAAVEAAGSMTICSYTDCSEIAEYLLKKTGTGKILRVDPPSATGPDRWLKILEKDRVEEYIYHEVYTDGRYIFDPRLSVQPVLRDEWEKMIRVMNPDATISEKVL
jgi:RHS repeat-associated protein